MTRYFSRREVVGMSLALAAGTIPLKVFAAEKPIRIGLGIGLTGSVAANGKAALMAMQIWAEDTNARGGILGRNVEIVYYDDQSNGSLVPGIYTKLLDVDKVDLIVSGYGTNFIAPLIPIAMRKKMVVMSLFGTNANSHFKYNRYFEIKPNGPDPAVDLTRGFFEVGDQLSVKPKTIAFVGIDNEYGAMVTQGARVNAKQLDLNIVYDKTYPPMTTNFSPIVAAVSTLKPDMVFVASYPPDTVGIVRAAHEVRLNTRMLGGGMVGLQYAAVKTQLGSLMNGLISPEMYVPAPTIKFNGIDTFLRKYQPLAEKEGVDPLGYYVPPFAYAMMEILGEAVAKTGGLDQAKIADYIHKTNFTTVVGDVKFGSNGEWEKGRTFWCQYHDVKGSSLDQYRIPGAVVDVLAPKEFRSGKLRQPYSSMYA
ncbi:Branched-chain amino acid transport system substrate-binding protein OS=Castellaniella defragrans OX=75697 GN=HNR28_003056 PE=3 SV=1 [Castellaniella defragrans]